MTLFEKWFIVFCYLALMAMVPVAHYAGYREGFTDGCDCDMDATRARQTWRWGK